MSRTISQEIKINASVGKIYAALSDPEIFSSFTHAKANIDLSVGGAVSLFDGMITGVTVEAIQNTRLIQVWRAGNWSEGSYSLVRFDLDDDNPGATIPFEHTGFPAQTKDHLEAGWYKMYWEPLKAYFES